MKDIGQDRVDGSPGELSVRATRRHRVMFEADLRACAPALHSEIRSSRVLVIGGAGSIGTSTILELLAFGPEALHVVDLNENNLAELVRTVRSGLARCGTADFRTLPIDFGSPIMQRFLLDQPPYDWVLNFAAVKHVRSEKDVCSILHMLDTNVLKPAKLLRWIAEAGGARGYFCVSTDKAANPVNLMGASKRLMEHGIFSGAIDCGRIGRVTSARFANVAFSDGSLLWSWLKRIEKRQPLAVPRATRRFFISLQEAGKICIVASVCAEGQHLLIPRLTPEADLVELTDVAEDFIRYHGYAPQRYTREDDAKSNFRSDVARGRYPLLLTPLDTAGEKPYEEFTSAGEQPVEAGWNDLLAVPYRPADRERLLELLAAVQGWVDNPRLPLTKAEIVSAVAELIPELSHKESRKNLDERM